MIHAHMREKAGNSIKQELSGIPETLLIPLWARASEKDRKNPIITDEKAVEIISQIDYDFSKFSKTGREKITLWYGRAFLRC